MRVVAREYEERNKSAQEWLRYERGDVCISNKTPAWPRRDTITGAKGHGSGSERTRERERRDTGAGSKRTRERGGTGRAQSSAGVEESARLALETSRAGRESESSSCLSMR